MEIYCDFSFDSAHLLPNVPKGHKCGRLHGHTYSVRIYVKGAIDRDKGWLNDFGEIKEVVKPIIEELDHRFINEIQGLENPTSENIARWIWQRLENLLPELFKVEIRETLSTGCAYSGGD